MQSVFHYAKTLKGEYSAAISLQRCNQSSLVRSSFGTKPKRTVVHKQSRQELDNPRHVLHCMQPLAGTLTGRSPDLQGMQPSAESLTGRPPDTVL